MDPVLDPLTNDASRTASLQDTVESLQIEMLGKVQNVEAVTDDRFVQEFRALASEVKSLSRRTPLDGDVDLHKQLASSVLLQNVLAHTWTVRRSKKCFIEAYIWSNLLEFVFRSPHAILESSLDELQIPWTTIFGNVHQHGWPTPSASSETWRLTTVKQLIGKVGQNVITSGKVDETCPRILDEEQKDAIIHARAIGFEAIRSGLSRISSTAHDSSFRTIVDKAFGLALEMSSQRYRVQITFSNTGASFEKSRMISLPSDTDEYPEYGAVAFVVNPGLTKWGDGLGENLNHRYDMVRSLVQLEPHVGGPESDMSLR
ncbi:hypothetical protein NX059_007704 [Plenodomus lindquistii]|nr:hypothetical protein NX059_007704 [Plenodomus lindquistii]